MTILFEETKLYKFSPRFWQYTILAIISLAFLLSDWIVLYSSFGDFILAFGIFLLVCLGQIRLSKKQIQLLSIPVAVLIVTIILSYLFNDYWISDKRILASSVKFLFYLFSTVIFYNFIKTKKLEDKFLKMSNVFALTAIVIGIILIILIYLDRPDIFRTIWTFTRTDNMSYFFIGNRDIVRARSLFSEPAHLGYYLNTIFYANLFSNRKNNLFVLSMFAVGILMTLSYSMIFIFILTGSSYIALRVIKGEFKWSHWYWVSLLPILAILYYFWEFINVTIIQRTINIINGTDGSAYNRLIESWIYVNSDRFYFGNGIGHTPPVTNVFAYMLSDFGLIGLVPYLGLTLFILLKNIPAFILFVTMNVAKGGYLNPAYWLFLLFLFIYGLSKHGQRKD